MMQGFLTLENGKQVHYRRIGEGPPLIMLHPSPQCSEALMMAAGYFSSTCTCLALDTPGYGYSDDLGIENPSIGDYADAVVAAIDCAGIDRFYLYGAATGSQIAIEIGKRHPERVAFLLLDSNGHVSDDDRDETLKGYFPDVRPIYGGGHFLTYWEMCRSLYVAFPWTSGKLSNGFSFPLPPVNIIHSTCMRYLRAGENYALAYRTAFFIEKRDHMDGLDVPTLMTRWADSPVKYIADALVDLGLPDCVRLNNAGAGIDARFNTQCAILTDELPRLDLPDVATLPDQNDIEGKLSSILVSANNQPIHVRMNKQGVGTPLVCLHDAFRSTAQIEKELQPVVGTRPLYLIDLPGHGLSIPANEDDVSVAGMAKQVAQVLGELNLDGAQILGVGFGGAVAAALAQDFNFDHLYVVDPLRFSEAERLEYLEKGVPDLSPQQDGTHLIRAWSFVRDNELYHPWYQAGGSTRRGQDADLDADRIHEKTVELLISSVFHSEISRTRFELDWPSVFAGLHVSHSVHNLISEAITG